MGIIQVNIKLISELMYTYFFTIALKHSNGKGLHLY